MRPPTCTPAEVVAKAAELVGVPVVRSHGVAGSVTNLNLRVDFADGRRALVKVGPRDQLRAEAWILERAARERIPVPSVLAVEHDADPALNVLDWIQGEPSDSEVVLVEVGRQIARLHAMPAPGYGLLAAGAGRHESWASFLAEELGGLDELVEARLLTATDAERVRVVAASGLGSWVGPGVLLHGDLKRLHLLERDGALAGIIDWGDPAVGDPRWDLARLSMMGRAALKAFLRGYGEALTADLEQMLAAYRVVWNVSALTYEYRAGGDWFDTYRDGLRADLDRLGG